jgi:hypothetical protein
MKKACQGGKNEVAGQRILFRYSMATVCIAFQPNDCLKGFRTR